ncbi:MAG: Ankyrin repeat/Ankyrin repeat [Chloroflexi bacterium]|jgi:hypothetical protein|nr:MAG: Ankyrin repeat/Ankyrin repeat [Chloroflexota bacterium]
MVASQEILLILWTPFLACQRNCETDEKSVQNVYDISVDLKLKYGISEGVVRKLIYTLGFVSILCMLFMVSCGGESNVVINTGDMPTGSAKRPTLDLLTAIDQGKVDIVEQHMAAGTDPNKDPIPEGISLAGAYPIHLAAVKGDKKTVQVLLSNGADIDLIAANKDVSTPLHWAAFFLQEEMVSFLIEAGAKVNVVDANKATALDAALIAKVLNLADAEKIEVADRIMATLESNGGKLAADL